MLSDRFVPQGVEPDDRVRFNVGGDAVVLNGIGSGLEVQRYGLADYGEIPVVNR